MAACPRCGSRSIHLVINPLTWPAHLVTDVRASRCPRCGWKGWKNRSEWIHIPWAGIARGGTGHTAPHLGRPLRQPGEIEQTDPAGDAPVDLPVDLPVDRPVEPPGDASAEAPPADQSPDLEAIDRDLAERPEHERHAQPSAGGHDGKAGPRDARSPSSKRPPSRRSRLGRARARVTRRRQALLLVALAAMGVALMIAARACSGGDGPREQDSAVLNQPHHDGRTRAAG